MKAPTSTCTFARNGSLISNFYPFTISTKERPGLLQALLNFAKVRCRSIGDTVTLLGLWQGKTVSASLIKLFQCLKTCFVKNFNCGDKFRFRFMSNFAEAGSFLLTVKMFNFNFCFAKQNGKNVYQSINHFKLQHKRVFFYHLIDSVTLMQRTSWPYFGVKLSCFCLMFAYRKKSNDLQ